MEKHVPNLFSALWGVCFLAILVGLSKLVRPDRRQPSSHLRTRSGEESDKPALRLWAGHQVLIVGAAVLFFGLLVLYPAIATFRQWLTDGRGLEALILVGLFIGTLAVALAYAWMRGDLTMPVYGQGKHKQGR